MKKLAVTLCGALLSLAALAAEPAMPGMAMPAGHTNPHASMPTWGTHGMAMFGGKNGLTAAHLPMAHPPHDYQAIFTFHVADAKIDAALRQRLEAPPTLWTIAPEKFELNRLDPASNNPLKHFKADIVLGHFEQDGKTEYPDVTIVVDKIELYLKL